MEVSPQRHSFSEGEKTAMKIHEPNIVLGNIFIFLYVFTITSSCSEGSDFQIFLRKVCICSIYFQSLRGFFKIMLFHVDQLWLSTATQGCNVGRPSVFISPLPFAPNTWDKFSVFVISQPEKQRRGSCLHVHLIFWSALPQTPREMQGWSMGLAMKLLSPLHQPIRPAQVTSKSVSYQQSSFSYCIWLLHLL